MFLSARFEILLPPFCGIAGGSPRARRPVFLSLGVDNGAVREAALFLSWRAHQV
jgi:hypothetical protein